MEVPEIECREAAVYVHTTWLQWQELDWRDRASAVAHYRLSLLIKAHVEDAATRASERAAARRAAKGG